ncbi:MAG: MBOAT family protein, partial [Proteobacteria bacterium]|nr:MBOAT family protein [Pseudomonadota bacterium]
MSSYIFYGLWDWRFLSLIWLSTIVDYICALKIDANEGERSRKLYLFISLATNLSILGFFKYFNFFAENLQGLASGFGLSLDYATLNIILPVGISFYTFQTMSYTIDVYRREMRPTKDFLDFALFVA